MTLIRPSHPARTRWPAAKPPLMLLCALFRRGLSNGGYTHPLDAGGLGSRVCWHATKSLDRQRTDAERLRTRTNCAFVHRDSTTRPRWPRIWSRTTSSRCLSSQGLCRRPGDLRNQLQRLRRRRTARYQRRCHATDSGPLTGPRFTRVSAPEANSCAGCHNQPQAGGAGDFVANVFVLAQNLIPVSGTILNPDFSQTFLERNTLGMFGSGALSCSAGK